MNNTDEVQSYINKHMNYIRHINPTKSISEKWVIDEHNKSFIKWFQNLVVSQLSTKLNCISENLRWLAQGPHMDVLSYLVYPTNSYLFYTKAHDAIVLYKTVRITVVVQLMHISSAKYKK